MNCPDCGTPDAKIVRTITGPRGDMRQRRCHCGTCWNTLEKPVKGTQVKLVSENGSSAPVKMVVKLPTAQVQEGDLGVSSPVLPVDLPVSERGSTEPVISPQTPARVKGRGRPSTREYTEGFLQFWEAITPRRGNKEPAFKAWVKFQGEIKDVNFIIERYMLRAGTSSWQRGFPQHVATWLNEKGWETEPDPSEFDSGVPEKVQAGRDSARRFLERHAG